MSLSPAQTTQLVDDVNRADRAQFDGGARAIQRWLVGSVDLTGAIEHFAKEVGRKLNHNLPLRSFTQTLWAGPIDDQSPTVSSSGRWNDYIYVWGYTATVCGLQFVENSTEKPDSDFYDARDYISVVLSDSSNQAITIANNSGMQGSLLNGIPLSELAGKGGIPAQVLATPYSAGSLISATFARTPNCGVKRVGAVGLTVHYVRLPIF